MEKYHPQKELREWLKTHHETNVFKVLWDIFCVWTVIIFSFWLALHFKTWWSYLLAIILIGSRQHALGTIVHDGTHFTLAKNRAFNDFICDFFCAFPIFISTRGFRVFHLTHHRYSRTEKDPEIHAPLMNKDWVWPKYKNEMITTLARDLFGVNAKGAIENIFIWSDIPSLLRKSKEHWLKQKMVDGIAEFLDRSHEKFTVKTSIKIGLIIYYSLFFGLIHYFNFWIPFLILWMVPMVTVVAFIIRVRGMSEHNGLPLTIELNSSRTTLWPNPVIAYFMTPFYVNHHLEHHLYPQVPYFHLQKLHNELMKDPVFKERAAISNNYFKNLIKT